MRTFKVGYADEHFCISHILVNALTKIGAIEYVHRRFNDYMIINITEI